jgi:hypothetical protein
LPRILATTTKPDDWKEFLADPVKHWRTNFSAKALAHCWEAADGMPPEICTALSTSPDGAFSECTPFLAVPEFKIDLPGGERPSQTDILVLGRATAGAFAIAVEGKVSESFGPLLGEWMKDASDGKKTRWKFLCKTLGLDENQSPELRYQLFHRAASAVLAARQFHAPLAVLLVQSFSGARTGWSDFHAFVNLFKVVPTPDSISFLATLGSTRLYAGWATGDRRFCEM